MAESNTSIRENHIIGETTRERIVTPTLCPALGMHSISIAGTTDAGYGFSFTRQRHSMCQILACVHGSGEVMVDGVWVPCPAGSAYVTPPREFHAYRAIWGQPWRLVWVIYDGAPQDVPRIAVDRPTVIVGDFKPLELAIGQLYDEMMGSANSGIMLSLAALVDGYAQRLLVPPTRLAPVWNALRANLKAPWTITEMASIAAVSTEHLRRLCYDETGTSPLRFLTQLRMREACALLASSSYTLTQVAERVGYENVFAFSTAFRRSLGIAPSDYRSSGGSVNPSGVASTPPPRDADPSPSARSTPQPQRS